MKKFIAIIITIIMAISMAACEVPEVSDTSTGTGKVQPITTSRKTHGWKATPSPLPRDTVGIGTTRLAMSAALRFLMTVAVPLM